MTEPAPSCEWFLGPAINMELESDRSYARHDPVGKSWGEFEGVEEMLDEVPVDRVKRFLQIGFKYASRGDMGALIASS